MAEKEFYLYDQAPGFWLYVALSLGADICEYPILSVKNSPDKIETYSYDLYDLFEDATARYEKRLKRGKYLG